MPVDIEKRQILQDKLADKATKQLLSGKDVTIVAPTGIGKTNIFINISRRFKNAREVETDIPATTPKILIVTDRINVAAQNMRRSRTLGSDNISLSTEGNFDQSGDQVYGSTKTIFNNRENLTPYDLVIIDECHHAADNGASQHAGILRALQATNAELKVLGLSAFIDRADGLNLHPRLKNADLMRITYKEALDVGAITPPKSTIVDRRLKDGAAVNEIIDARLDPDKPDSSLGGIEKALREGRPDNFFSTAVTEWKKVNGNATTPTFVYCTTIKDSELAVEAFEEQNVPVAILHSKLSPRQQEAAFDDYRSGKAVALVSVDMLTEGVDETKTASVLLLKEVTTRAQWTQINGRAARAHSDLDPATGNIRHKESYNIIDMGASTRLHGTMDVYRQVEEYVFWKEEEKPANDKAAADKAKDDKARLWSPWRTVQSDNMERNETQIYALHDGHNTLFAARVPKTNVFTLFTKDEIRIGSRKNSAVTAVKKLTPLPQSIENLIALGRTRVENRMGVFVTLDSRSGSSSLTSICRQSFAESKESLKRFMTPAPAQMVAKRKIAGHER